MSQLQLTADEEQQATYSSAPPTAASTEESSIAGEATGVASLDTIPITARQVRSDELLAALATLEARKNDTIAGTIPIRDALERMQTDVTAEEVWQEVYASRVQQRKSGTPLELDVLSRRKRFVTVGGAVAALFTVAILLRIGVGDIRSQREIQVPQDTSGLNYVPMANKPPPLTLRFLQEPFQRRAQNTIPLSQILRENRMLRMDLEYISGLRKILYGNTYLLPMPRTELEKIRVFPHEGTQSDWLVNFQKGRAYLRGWIAIPPDPDTVRMLAQKIAIYNRPDDPKLAGKEIRQISIPLDGIGGYTSASDGVYHNLETRITHLDGEAWKSWEAPPLPVHSGAVSSRSANEL